MEADHQPRAAAPREGQNKPVREVWLYVTLAKAAMLEALYRCVVRAARRARLAAAAPRPHAARIRKGGHHATLGLTRRRRGARAARGRDRGPEGVLRRAARGGWPGGRRGGLRWRRGGCVRPGG
jgi:hypothetical protein